MLVDDIANHLHNEGIGSIGTTLFVSSVPMPSSTSGSIPSISPFWSRSSETPAVPSDSARTSTRSLRETNGFRSYPTDRSRHRGLGRAARSLAVSSRRFKVPIKRWPSPNILPTGVRSCWTRPYKLARTTSLSTAVPWFLTAFPPGPVAS